jgi:dinuclear metal center YbgI/SA1388 family protein
MEPCIRDIIGLLERWAPPEYQENYDNSGLITGDQNLDCTGVLVCLDSTEKVILEAEQNGCNLIVSHHPLIFKPVRNILPDNSTGKILIHAIRNGIAIYAIHTNLDNVLSGVNAAIADKLGLKHREILKIQSDNPYIGSGLIGDLPKPVTELQLLALVKQLFRIPVIRYSPLTGKSVSRIAVCGGAGSFLITNALEAGADFFLTADLKYHEFFIPEGDCVLADIGHFESEQFTIDLLHDAIRKKYPNFAVLKSSTVTNPVNYYL